MTTETINAMLFQLVGLVLSSLAGVLLIWLASYVRERTHNERLARIVDALGRTAADINSTLALVPPGSSWEVTRATLIERGVEDLAKRMPDTLKAVGQPTKGTLNHMLSGELAKLPPAGPQPFRYPVALQAPPLSQPACPGAKTGAAA